jgi:hypothetical protein
MSGLIALAAVRDARDQATAADRHHQHVQIRGRLQHLEHQRALARDDQQIVIGVNESQIALGRDLVREHGSILDRIALEHDLGAKLGGLLDLHERSQARHHDGRRDSQPRGVAGHALGVIAGRHGDHAAAPLVLAEARELDASAALLERRATLKRLELQRDVAAQEPGQVLRRQARREHHLTLELAGGGLHVGEAYHLRRPFGLRPMGTGPAGRARRSPAGPASGSCSAAPGRRHP